VSQLLFSFATYMHDAYLPVYLQDVLGLSNTKVRKWMLAQQLQAGVPGNTSQN
jgi:hypothetical protein